MEQKFIPLSVPNLKGNELKYVTQAVENEWVSTGGERCCPICESSWSCVLSEWHLWDPHCLDALRGNPE
jgi:hypothetical protein